MVTFRRHELEIERIKHILSEVDKYYLVFEHPESKQIIKSRSYSLIQLSGGIIDEVREQICICDCQPVGETYVIECNCSDYYDEFELKAIEQDENIAKTILAEMYNALEYGCKTFFGSIDQSARKIGLIPSIPNSPLVSEGDRTWFNVKCNCCNWQGSSEFLQGGGAIADTGDCNDPFCPNCGETDIDDMY